MEKKQPDLLVVGGGPAGLSLGIMCARAGLRTVVVEKKCYPVSKPCGEGLMPRGVACLRQIVPQEFIPSSGIHSFRGIRYISPMGNRATGYFPKGEGWGIERTVLSEMLLRTAEQEERLTLLQNSEAQLVGTPHAPQVHVGDQVFWPQILVGADGLHSKVRRWAGLDGSKSDLQRWGLQQHLYTQPWSNLVEVYWNDQMEAYITPVSPHKVGVAFLSRKGALPQHKGRLLIHSILEDFPELKEKLGQQSAEESFQGIGPLHQKVKGIVHGRVLLFGDAAGYLDAITGEGISNALEQALQLASILGKCFCKGVWQRHYTSIHRGGYYEYALFVRLVLMLHQQKIFRESFIRLSKSLPIMDQALTIRNRR